MTSLSYPPARVVAERLHAYFAAAVPECGAAAMEAVTVAAFWASLRQEEGRAPRISLTLLPPERTEAPLLLESRLPLDPDALAQLAPAVDGPGIHMGVWPFEDEPRVWGTLRDVPPGSFVLEVVAPGLLVVKTRRTPPSTKFGNLAVLEGASVKFVDLHGAGALDPAPGMGALHAFYTSGGQDEADSVFVHLAISMRAHGRGGILLVVPDSHDDWRDSVVQPVGYSVKPPFAEVAELLARDDDPPETLRAAVEALAGFTAVDGATVIDQEFRLLAFGVKIARRKGARPVEQVLVSEPIEGAQLVTLDPTVLGGTRHLSAAQFVHDQQDAIALVASQDRRFTVFAWSPGHRMVHAHRLEALLL